MNKTQIFKTIKSLEGFDKSIEHDSFEKSKKNADKPFQKYEFLGDRVLGLVISEYLITTFSHNTLDEISRRFIHLVNTDTLAKIFKKNKLATIFKHQLDPNSNKNSIYAVCGDATGHGTSSGMMVSIIKSGLNGLPSLSTDKVLYELNNIVKKIDLGTLKMSLNICEVKNGSITLSSAAMPPIYLYNSKSKKTEEILIRGLPLGGLKNETFDIQKKKFNKGDVLVMLSDGLPEAENDAGELYDYERVVKLITQNATKTAEQIKDKMIGEVDIWLDGRVPDDDVSIVVVKKV